MACSCITTFNYAVEFQDCNTIIYNDMSVWVEVPETYTIVITYSGGTLTQVVSNRNARVFGWYDNEWGYSERLKDFLLKV